MSKIHFWILVAAELFMATLLAFQTEWLTAQILLLTQGASLIALVAVDRQVKSTGSSKPATKWMVLFLFGFCGVVAFVPLQGNLALSTTKWQDVGRLLAGEQRELSGFLAASFGAFSVLGTLLLRKGAR